MKKKLLLFVVAFVQMSLCIPMGAPKDVGNESAKNVPKRINVVAINQIDGIPLNVDLFSVPEEAALVDYFFECPGVMIGKDGIIRRDGKEISRILYGGKEMDSDFKKTTLFTQPHIFSIGTVTVTFSIIDKGKAGDENLEVNISNLPGVEIDNDGSIVINGKKVPDALINGQKNVIPNSAANRPEVKAVIAKMDGKGSRPLTPEELAASGLIGIPIPLPEGETVESYLLKHPGVHKDDEGNIIYPNGRKLTPEDIKQIEQIAHISIKDSLLKYQQKYQQKE